MARRIQKEQKPDQTKEISAFRFVAGLAGVLLLFFGLFCVIGVIADTVKYTMEGEEAIEQLERSIADSEKRAEDIANNYESEIQKKAAFVSWIYEHDRELLEDPESNILAGGRQFAVVDAQGETVLRSASFPALSKTRVLNYIRDVGNGADTTDYMTVDEQERILFSALPSGEYLLIVDDLMWREYIENTVSDAKSLVAAAETAHSYVIAERDGMYYAGPSRLNIEEETPIADVLRSGDSADNETRAGTITETGSVNGEPCLVIRRSGKAQSGIRLYYIIDIGYVLLQSVNTILATFAAMICALIVLLYYLIQYRRGRQYEQTPAAERDFRNRRRILVILGTALTALVAYYARTVFCISSYVMDDKKEIESLKEEISENERSSEDVIASFHFNYEEEIRMAARYLSLRPERINEDTLRTLSDIFGFEYLMIFDENGNEVISDSDFINLKLSENKDDFSYFMRSLLKGGYDHCASGEDDMTGMYRTYAAELLTDEHDTPVGVACASMPISAELSVWENNSMFTVLDSRTAGGHTDFYLLDKEGTFFYHTPNGGLDGLNPADYGFTPAVLEEGFSGGASLNGVPHYLTQGTIDELYVYTALPFSLIYGTRLPFTAAAALSALFILHYASRRCRQLKITRVSAGRQPERETLPAEAEGEGITAETMAPASLASGAEKGLPATAGEKTTVLILRLCQIVGVVIAVILIFRERLLPENSMIRRVMDGGWQRGVNIYAVTAVLILILTVVIGISILLYVLKVLSRILSPRGETICRLLRSAAEYLSVIMAVYTALGFLGVRVETVITTASVMALLVGMGAQDLTADIIAGLFLMFESEFQVGDVIDTGGKTGIVKEIGLHSTKLIDFDNNVLIISNSKLADIINRTQRNSFAFTEFIVSSDVKIRDLEELFRRELPPLKMKYPKFAGEPYFRGVTGFTGSKMKCSIAAEVSEKDRPAMQRVLNREVLRILKSADIAPL